MKESSALKTAIDSLTIDTCLLCGHALSISERRLFDTRFGIGVPFAIGKCSNCDLEQTLPRLASDELKDFYETYYNFGGSNESRYTRLREMFLFSLPYRLWLRLDGDISFHLQKGSGRLIDIGCNEGRGLRIYRQNGFHAEGLELNEKAAHAARSQGFTVHTELLEDFRSDCLYDVVVLSNVLEHSLDPKAMLADAKRILKQGGEIWLSCPNNKSWLRSLFGQYWVNWHVPFHIVHFSPSFLARLLEENGFEAVVIKQKTPALWVAHSFLTRVFFVPGKQTKQLRSPLLVAGLILVLRGLFFPLLWIGNRLNRGDCLVVKARKA